MSDLFQSDAMGAVDLTLEAHLGKTTLTISELNALSNDATLELDSTLDQAVELKLNGVTIAHGELVAVGDKFAVKLSKIAK